MSLDFFLLPATQCKVRDSVWMPFLSTYTWVSENNATVSDILIKTKDVGGGILGGKWSASVDDGLSSFYLLHCHFDNFFLATSS